MSWAWSQLQKSGPAKTGPAGPLATALHMTREWKLLAEYEKFDKPQKVSLGDGRLVDAVGTGNVH